MILMSPANQGKNKLLHYKNISKVNISFIMQTRWMKYLPTWITADKQFNIKEI